MRSICASEAPSLGSTQDLDVVRAHQRPPSSLTGPTKRMTNSLAGLLVEVARRADLLDRAVVEDHDLLGDLHRLLLVVRDEHRRHVDLVVQAAQPGAQLLAHRGVERAEGLVEQQHPRLHRQRARQRHALALAAGELRRVAVGEAVEAAPARAARRRAPDLLLGPLADRQPERDVVAHGHVLERRRSAGRRSRRRGAAAATAVASSPPITTRPRRAPRGPAMMRSSVDLPLPLGPSSAVSEPSGTSSETSSSATKSPNRFDDVLDRDAHQRPLLRGSRRFIAEQRDEREQGEHDRRGVGAGRSKRWKRFSTSSVSVSVWPDELAGDDADRAELAERAGGREHHAVGDAPADRRQRDAPEGLQRAAPRVAAACSCSVADLAQHRDDLAHDERQRDEDRRQDHARDARR